MFYSNTNSYPCVVQSCLSIKPSFCDTCNCSCGRPCHLASLLLCRYVYIQYIILSAAFFPEEVLLTAAVVDIQACIVG